MLLDTFREGLLASTNLNYEVSHRHGQRVFSSLILYRFKLTIIFVTISREQLKRTCILPLPSAVL